MGNPGEDAVSTLLIAASTARTRFSASGGDQIHHPCRDYERDQESCANLRLPGARAAGGDGDAHPDGTYPATGAAEGTFAPPGAREHEAA